MVTIQSSVRSEDLIYLLSRSAFLFISLFFYFSLNNISNLIWFIWFPKRTKKNIE